MILVDTSVLIDLLKGNDNEKVKLFEHANKIGIPWAFASFTYQELLQGARDESDFMKLKAYLDTQTILFPESDKKFYSFVANMYFKLRKNGKTIRSTIDLLIAGIAIKNKLQLLHDDRDFDFLAEEIKELHCYNG